MKKINKNTKVIISLSALVLTSALVLSSCGSAELVGKTIVNAAESDMITDTEKTTMSTDEKIDDSMADKDNEMVDSTMEKSFSLPDVAGNTVNLSDYAGKKVYIKFWATWCPICLGGLEEFTELTKDMSMQDDTVILTIVSPGTKGEMSKDDFVAWYEKQGYSFPVLLDQDGTVARDFNVRGYPTSVFIDTTGSISQSRPGHVGNDDIKTILSEMK